MHWILRTLPAVALLCLLWPGTPLPGQEPPHPGAPPAEVREAAIRLLNDPGTLRLSAGARIPEGTSVQGSVGVLSGDLFLGGEIQGDLVVLNGHLRFGEGAVVEGAVVVLGGSITGLGLASVADEVLAYQGPVRYRIREGRVEEEPTPRLEGPGFLEQEVGPARVRFTARASGNYNRVEGLPVSLGPILRIEGRNPFTLEAFGIWRSVDGLELERENLGYHLRAEQGVGGRGEISLALSTHSRVVPIEDRGLTDLEASLGTFLLRRDFRDYLEESGWEVAIGYHPLDQPFRLHLRYREDRQTGVPVREPWTVRDQTRAWRPPAAVGEGPIRWVAVDALLDTRDDAEDPTRGWWLSTRLQRLVGGELRLPTLTGTDGVGRMQGEDFPLASRGHLDLRRYDRIGPGTRIRWRLMGSGSLDGTPLPPQHQRTLGGEGSLPGHPGFSVDCGARSHPQMLEGETVFPFYGCDRILLGQVELQGTLPFSPHSARAGTGRWEWDALLQLRPSWSLFLNGGRGWTRSGSEENPLASDSLVRADVGAGLFLGPLGLYWAYPLNRRDQGINFFLRLQQRF